MQLGQVLEFETVSAAPFKAAGITITPQAQVLIVRLPFGGFVWNRPIAVVVERDGERERVPIVDVTRRVQLALLGLGLMLMLLGRRKKRKRKEL